jgi:hypothetical protein
MVFLFVVDSTINNDNEAALHKPQNTRTLTQTTPTFAGARSKGATTQLPCVDVLRPGTPLLPP